MGQQLAAIRFPDSTIMYTTFQDTSDVLSSALFDKVPSLKELNISVGTCTHKSGEPVEIVTIYGMYWTGEACQKCKAITKQCNPYVLSGWGGVEVFPGAKDLRDDYYPDWFPFGGLIS